MIPWVSDGETAFEVNSSLKTEQSDGDSTSNSSKTKFNKSIILQKAIDYIVYLRNNEHLYQTEIDCDKKLKRFEIIKRAEIIKLGCLNTH